MEDLMQRYQVTDEKALSAIETGAKMLADDVRKLPKPRSKMTGSGYTHLLDTVTTRRTKGEIEVGWGEILWPNGRKWNSEGRCGSACDADIPEK